MNKTMNIKTVVVALAITTKQLRKIVLKYFNEHPEDLHLTASSIVPEALNRALPPSYKEDDTTCCESKGE